MTKSEAWEISKQFVLSQKDVIHDPDRIIRDAVIILMIDLHEHVTGVECNEKNLFIH